MGVVAARLRVAARTEGPAWGKIAPTEIILRGSVRARSRRTYALPITLFGESTILTSPFERFGLPDSSVNRGIPQAFVAKDGNAAAGMDYGVNRTTSGDSDMRRTGHFGDSREHDALQHRTSPRAIRTVLIVTAAILFALCDTATATFHFMQIEQVVGGVNGDASAQAIQLRMRNNGQHEVSKAKLIAWDADGENPIVLLDISVDVTEDTAGARVLLASSGLSHYTDPPLEPDFVLDQLLPESYLAAGSITFENDSSTLIVCRLSWGGANYRGSTLGATSNDSDGDFGPPFRGPLPSEGLEGLLFSGSITVLHTSNFEDFALTEAEATLTNNAGETFVVTAGPCAEDRLGDDDGDGVCGTQDNCPDTANVDQTDGDRDGFGNACDPCATDPAKSAPGACGCGEVDADLDRNGVIDCLEADGGGEDGEPGEDSAPPEDDTGDDGASPDGMDSSNGPNEGGSGDPDVDDSGTDDGVDDTNADEARPPGGGTAAPLVLCGPGMVLAVGMFSLAYLCSRSPWRRRADRR